MDTFLSIIPSGTFLQNTLSTKNTVLPGASSKVAGKAFVVKIENKMIKNKVINDI